MYTCESITNKSIEQSSLHKAKAVMEDLGMKDLLMKGKQWYNIYGDSKDDEIKEKVDDVVVDDCDGDGDCKVADDHVPLISEPR